MIDFTTLVADSDTEGSIRNWVNDTRVPSVTILTEAQAWIYSRLRVRQMLFTATGAMVIGDDTIALPTGYKAPYLFRFTGVDQSRPRYKLLDYVLSRFTYDSNGARTRNIPNYFATDEANIQFESETNKALNYLFKHYRSLPALDADNLTNFLTEDYPYLLRAICLHRAYEHLKNTKEKQYWLAIAEAQILIANTDSDLELMGVEMDVELDGGEFGLSSV